MSTVAEIAEGIYRLHTSIQSPAIPGGFSYNQYLVLDEQPLLFHTGSQKMLAEVASAVETVVPLARLRYIAFSHWEQDECGGLDGLLERAPQAQPLCSRVNAIINRDGMSRPARALQDGETLSLGKRRLRWFETPHVPHGWESGLPFEETTRTLFCGDLFTQPGTADEPLVEGDIFGPSEELRRALDYFAHGANQRSHVERLAAASPRVLACMHGHAWRGDGAALLRQLAAVL
ncbi:MAG: FprA family A-type flavoprotein [Myxococcales bacterium]